MNLSNIRWPDKVYKDEWLGGKSSFNKLSTFKIMDGTFRDPLESSDDEIIESPNNKKKHLIDTPFQHFQHGPATPVGNTRLDKHTHIYMINMIANKMNSIPGRKYFPMPKGLRPCDFDFQPSLNDIAMEQTSYRDQMARSWERSVRVRLNSALENNFNIYKTHKTNSTVNRLPEYYKMAAQITPDVKEDVKILHVEKLLTLGGTLAFDSAKFRRKITLSIDDQPLCPQHGISLATAPFLSEMAECKRLCRSNNSSFAIAESALVALLDSQQSYLIPLSVNETDFGLLVSIENTLSDYALTTCEGTRKLYELLFLKALCHTLQNDADGTNSSYMSNKMADETVDDIATFAKVDLGNDMGKNLSSDEDDEEALRMDLPDDEVNEKIIDKSSPIKQTENLTNSTPLPEPERRKSQRISNKVCKQNENLLLSPELKRSRLQISSKKDKTAPEKDKVLPEKVKTSPGNDRTFSKKDPSPEKGTSPGKDKISTENDNIKLFKKCICPGRCMTFHKWQILPKMGSNFETPFNIIVRSEDYLSMTTGDNIRTSVLLEKWAAAGSMKNKTIPTHEDDINPGCTLTAHVDVHDGSVLMFRLDEPDVEAETNKATRPNAGIIHSILKTLKRLIPGDYILHHNPSHGASIMLLTASSYAQSETVVALEKLLSDRAIRAGEEQMQSLPTLDEDLMLPWQWMSIHGPLLFKGIERVKGKGKGKKKKKNTKKPFDDRRKKTY